MMTPAEDEAFGEFLLQKASEAEKLGYPPGQFKRMVRGQGGEATVRQLLLKGKPSTGFNRLWELGRLDLTVEALVVETEWRSFFDPALVRHAEQLLARSEYSYVPFSGAHTASTASAVREPAPEAPPLVPQRPSQRKSTLSFSAFCAQLGAPLANPADRWCGYNPQRRMAVFTLWADRLQGNRYLLWDSALRAGDKRIGATELKRVLQQVAEAGHSAYGIRCEARDVNANPRQRGYFDQDEVLVLALEQVGSDVVANVVGAASAEDVASGRFSLVKPFESAIDDLGAPPAGATVPERVRTNGGMGYRRDEAVRKFVIRRSGGKCEYCGTFGFEMAGGSRYVEAHHVIALSAEGPDTVENVIALCPGHHREAHYGERAEALEAELVAILQRISGR